MNTTRWLSLPMISLLLFSTNGLANLTVPMSTSQYRTIEHPHRQLRHILQQPPFQQWRLREKAQSSRAQNPLEDTIGRQWDRWMKWLDRYFRSPRHGSLRGNHSGADFSFFNFAGFLKILGLVLGVALVAGIIVVFFRWRAVGKTASGSADGLLSRDKILQAMEQGDALAMASDFWMRAARQFGSDGDFRAMYRAMYLSLLAGLHETGKIRFRRNHTNWHYVRDFHGDKPEQALFGSLTDLFDHVWYGRKLYPNINPDSLRDQIRRLIVKPVETPPVSVFGISPTRREDLRA